MLHEGFRPMEAAKEHKGPLKVPCIIQPKMDGIRCITIPQEGVVTGFSRSLLPIPNQHVQVVLSRIPAGLDGELMAIKRDADGVRYASYNETQSAIMSEGGEPEFHFIVFDAMPGRLITEPYWKRLEVVQKVVPLIVQREPEMQQWIRSVYSIELMDEDQLPGMVDMFLDQKWEGAMTRSRDGLYKFGRSTPTEQSLVKHKRFFDQEVTITGAKPKMHNTNEATVDARGLTKRSGKKSGLVPLDMLGAFEAVTDDGKDCEVGSGFTDDQRRMFWDMRDKLVGRRVTVRYQEELPSGAPRFPIFAGFRLD